MDDKMPERVPTDTGPNAAYTRFRNDALDKTGLDVILRGFQEIPVPVILRIVMEFGYAGASASMVADVNAGRVSLLFSNGGGYLGGGLHEEVRQTLPPFFEAAKRCLPHMKPATSFAVPDAGQITFYFLTTSGVVSGGGAKDDLAEDRSPLSPLFHAGQIVLTQLRLRAEQGRIARQNTGDRIGKKACPGCGKDVSVYAATCRHCKVEL
jgi:hypothetical protein